MTTDRLATFAEARLQEDLGAYAAAVAFDTSIIGIWRKMHAMATTPGAGPEIKAQADAIGALVETLARRWDKHPDYEAASGT